MLLVFKAMRPIPAETPFSRKIFLVCQKTDGKKLFQSMHYSFVYVASVNWSFEQPFIFLAVSCSVYFCE